jgi:hypothetical protein
MKLNDKSISSVSEGKRCRKNTVCYNKKSMEFIRSATKHGTFSGIIHILFNVLFAGIVWALVVVFPSMPIAAMGLVVLAKWRTLAVRPRYWWTNFLSNLPDLLLGLGVVVFMWQSGVWQIQLVLTALYIIWLTVIKPQHKHHFILIQVGAEQFVALAALFSIDYDWPVWVVVLASFTIAFATARQLLAQYDEKSRNFLATAWGLIVAELSFVAWHWSIAYQITPTLKVSQFAIIVTILAFVTERGYHSYSKHDHIRWVDIQWPVMFAGVVISVLLFLFSGLWDAASL